jgi:predicted transcriptional regulator
MRKNSESCVYDFVCECPGCSTYHISKELGMSGGKIRYFLSRLKHKKLIKFKFERKNPRIKKLSYPVGYWYLLPKTIKMELGRIRSSL